MIEEPRFIVRTRPRRKPRRFGTWDLETFGIGGPFAGGVTFTLEEGAALHDSIESVFKALLNPPRPQRSRGRASRGRWVWYAHNGARYDFTYVAKLISEYATANGVTVETTQQGTKIIGLTIPTDDGPIALVDSLPLLMGSLADVSRAFAPDRPKSEHCPDHDFTADETVFWSPDCPVCIDYMVRDAETLYLVMLKVEQVIWRMFGVQPAITTGATAMKAFIAMMPKDHVYWRQDPAKEAFLRRFACGSLTYPGCTSDVWLPEPGSDTAAITYDRSAAFAACMMEGGYPVSPGVWVTERIPGHLGYYQCQVTTADNEPGFFPFIPVWTDHGRKFAVGAQLPAYLTSEMIDMATAHGYQVTIVKGLAFERCEDVFSGFVRKCERFEYPPDGSDADPAVRAIAKNMRNSLNGKFNMKAETERLFIGDPPADLATDGLAHPVVDSATGEALPLWSMTEEVDAPYIHPEWYALTTTRQILCMARILLQMEPAARGKVDTDSITGPAGVMADLAARGVITEGRGYGAWKIEHSWAWVQSLGVKNYLGDEWRKSASGAAVLGQVDYCKGIPRKVMKANRAAHLRAAAGEKVQLTFDSLRTTKEMIEAQLDIPGVQRIRSIGIPDTCHGWVWDEVTHDFRPVRI